MATKAQKEANLRLFNKRRQKILDATNNGRCWWLYQQLTSVKRFKASDGR
tara:strand:- start:1083 stop:1232 length:150 start_codon:yes stop_codon:yes gene_type:complete